MRVFISHSSKDKPAVERLAQALRERGIEPWLDKWEISAGDGLIDRINIGLGEAAAAVIVFSRAASESRWVAAEVDYLTFARIEEGKVVVPVRVDADAPVPPLLRQLLWRGIDEHDAIADALLRRSAKPAPVRSIEGARIHRVLVSLRHDGDAGVRVGVQIGSLSYPETVLPTLPAAVREAHAAFVDGAHTAAVLMPPGNGRAIREQTLTALGRALGALCLPGDAAAAVVSLVDGAPIGTTIEVMFEADTPALLALPFEALRLPDDRLLSTCDAVLTMRRPIGVPPNDGDAMAGPLKLLVSVGAPDEDNTTASVLDLERELQVILDATDAVDRNGNVQVRILEVGSAQQIGEAVGRDAYHVLHLTCHGKPGVLLLEDEDGKEVPTTAAQLLKPIRETGRPLPLVLLSSCHGGVIDAATPSSFAEELLRAGVPAVVAMLTSVSERYATRLAGVFYDTLSSRELLTPSHALATARKALEAERLKRIAEGASAGETPPEYATAALFVAGEDRPLADFGNVPTPLGIRPVHADGGVAGSVPQLRMDDLIGRRRELRVTLRALRTPPQGHSGVVLTGIGGVGKSAIAGRAMQRVAESGWLLAPHVGRLDLAAIARTIGVALLESGGDDAQRRGALLVRGDLDDQTRLALVTRALAEAEKRVLLVLDDFEQNLVTGGGTFIDPTLEQVFGALVQSARRGRLLVTCRYPVPGMESYLVRVPVGPLSDAEVRKLRLRLPALQNVDTPTLRFILRTIGGHPRMLEFLDALMRGGKARMPDVARRLTKLTEAGALDEAPTGGDLADRAQAALFLGMRDVLLDELLAIARAEGIDDVLLQTAVSNLPVGAAGLARMLAGDEGDVPGATRALQRLDDLSMVHRSPDGEAWVHRWTAQGLARLAGEPAYLAASRRAGAYRWWRVEHETHDLGDAVEAVRNQLAGRDFDTAVAIATACFGALTHFQQSIGIVALAGEVLESLPDEHGGFASVADAEAQSLLALGATDEALVRYRRVLAIAERLATAEPGRADYQRDLSVSYNKLGDLHQALGEGAQARTYFGQSLAIRERLAAAEPGRADYQRDLSVSYERLGDLRRALGEGVQARTYFGQSLAIRERLAAAEPGRADYQRDLSVSYNKLGDLHRALGEGVQARTYFEQSLAIGERLAAAEPGRADYQRDLSVSYNRLGDLHRVLGEGAQARDYYEKDLAIAERLAAAEPGRADYQRDLSVSYERLGDLHRALGEGAQARDYYEKALAIGERLAVTEPGRADYQRDLSVSYNKLGDLHQALGEGAQARTYFGQSLAIRERLATAEPERADYRKDLILSLYRVGVNDAMGGTPHLQRALVIAIGMQERGHLNPTDEPLIPALQQLLRERGAET